VLVPQAIRQAILQDQAILQTQGIPRDMPLAIHLDMVIAPQANLEHPREKAADPFRLELRFVVTSLSLDPVFVTPTAQAKGTAAWITRIFVEF
jgi:hypothetical protein